MMIVNALCELIMTFVQCLLLILLTCFQCLLLVAVIVIYSPYYMIAGIIGLFANLFHREK